MFYSIVDKLLAISIKHLPYKIANLLARLRTHLMFKEFVKRNMDNKE